MGGLSVAAGVLGGLSTAFSTHETIEQKKIAKEQLKQQIKRTKLTAKQREFERQNLLREQIGRYKAKVSASGVDVDDGTPQAVISGMMKRADDDSFYDSLQTRWDIKDLNSRKKLLGSKLSDFNRILGSAMTMSKQFYGGYQQAYPKDNSAVLSVSGNTASSQGGVK